MESKILHGQRTVNQQGNQSNKIIGAHGGQISNNHPLYAVETIETYADGSRKAKLITQFPDGNTSRIKTSTLFPEGWSDSKTISAVQDTGNSRPVATRAPDGASLHQSTVDGVKVEVIKVGDNVTAGYPCGAGCIESTIFSGM